MSGVVNPDQKQTRTGSLGGRMSQFDQVVEQGKFESLRWRSAGQREADKH
ncbi:MAG: hypothetical protein M3O82_08610 [Verrucomicrobiota bacterium]|nr:hypothetical protein [Verrucomicrobiota bacterium]